MYEVEHCCALSEKQQDALAEAITDIHSEQFGAVRLFVNVRFTDVSEDKTYIAGKKVPYTAPSTCNMSQQGSR